nr:FkbM family methyltransferase [Ectothiorhodospira haloalkaliphila]
MLWRALKGIESGFYIDIGAAWPEQDSVTHAFYQRGWRGINVEPNPALHEQLIQQRPRDVNLKMAVADAEQTGQIHVIPHTGLSSLDASIVCLHEQAGYVADTHPAKCITLKALWQQYVPPGQSVHFLKVDVEGLETAVLKGHDWACLRPWIVIVEATVPLSQTECHESWESILMDADYQFVYADGLNRFYVAGEHAQLGEHFTYPPNVFDGFIRRTEFEAHARAIRSENQAWAAHGELQALHQSRSWKLTAPLRALVERVRHARNGRQSDSAPLSPGSLKAAFARALSREPSPDDLDVGSLPAHYQPEWNWFDGEAYETLRVGELTLHFHLGALRDRRGLGRHARELLYELRRLCSSSGPDQTSPAAMEYYVFSTLHWCPESLPRPSAVMIHDVTPLLMSERFGHCAQRFEGDFQRVIAQADRLLTVSESSSKDIQARLPESRPPVEVVANGVTVMAGEARPPVLLPDRPYFVFLGTCDLHKNLDVLFEALSLSDGLIHLVLIGPTEGFVEKLKQAPLAQDHVTIAGRLNDQEAAWLIKRSVAMVFPSLYEGFGLPPLEAALLGVPSICSRRPAMVDVLAGSAIFCEPDSPYQWLMAMHELMKNPGRRNALGEKAFKRASDFTWSAAAQRLVALLKSSTHGPHEAP